MDRLIEIALPIIALLESGGDPNALNEREDAVGILQIRPICLRDVNENLREGPKFSLYDRRDPELSAKMFRAYIDWYLVVVPSERPEATIEKIARIWNGGPSGPSKQSTASYGMKAVKLFKELQNASKLNKISQSLTSCKCTHCAHRLFELLADDAAHRLGTGDHHEGP